nr:hypothetical protein [Tanacetum cinerariifolium]
MIIKKDSKRKSLALKAKKESSNEEGLTLGSEDEEYTVANVQNHRKIRTKEHFSEVLGAIAVKKMMRRVSSTMSFSRFFFSVTLIASSSSKSSSTKGDVLEGREVSSNVTL